MAYAAVISLDQTIQRLLDSPNLISISSSTQKKLKNVQKPVKSLKEVLKSLDGSSEMKFEGAISIDDLDTKIKRLDDTHGKSSATLTALDGQIRDAIHTFEDILDFHLSDKFLSHHKRRRNNRILSLDLDTDQVWQGIKAFVKAAKKLEAEYVAELDNLIFSEQVDDAETAPSYTDFGVEMVGFSNNFAEIKDQMLRKNRPSDFAVFSILGVAGTGRTAAARASFDYLCKSAAEDSSTADGSEQYLDCGAWVTVGPNYQIEEIVATIIAQINESNSDSEEDEEDLYASLKGRRYMIVLDSRADDDSVECENNSRRLCLRHSIALIDEDVYNSLASAEAARSLLCFGPLNIYPVPINLGLRLLRVLDALTIRFYEFPADVVELAHLRYLALTCDGNLPTSISKLWFLHFLIVHRYHSVRSSRNCLNLPLEIWDMKELRHLQVSGGSLLDPADGDANLPNLSTLLDVSVQSCTEKILGRMPNLKKIGIRIELAPRDASEKTFHCLNFKSALRRLKSLRYVIVNPEFNSEVKRPFVPIPVFSSALKKLKLSGFGYPWEYMSIIGKLRNLKVLKLQCYAFCGPQWDTENNGFRKLEYLSIEDSDVVNWNVKRSNFPELRYVIIKHCYKLKELPYHLSSSMVLIEVIDCNPLVVKWAKQMEEKETKNVIGSRTIGIEAHSSWEK